MRQLLDRYGLYAAWLVSLIATGGSLYFSEIRGFIPCELCWVQRIFMYPLTVILGIASYIGDYGVKRYVLPLVAIGWSFSTIHYLHQKGVLFQSLSCASASPCNQMWINWFGFITIPLLAWTAFLLIGILLYITKAPSNLLNQTGNRYRGPNEPRN